jgi:hypothetical protein
MLRFVNSRESKAQMPRLKVRPIAAEDVYKDIIRIPEKYRTDKKGKPIEESTACWIEGVPIRSIAVLRGLKTPNGEEAPEEIHMDERTRSRLGVQVDETYDFTFVPAGLRGQLVWAWSASETGHRVSTRIALIGLILGVIRLILGIVALLFRTI